MGSKEQDRRAAAILRAPTTMFTGACPPFGRLMDIARGSAPMDQERLHLGRGCSYCAMTLRQSFCLSCPPDAVIASSGLGRALAHALEEHVAGCLACRRRTSPDQPSPGPRFEPSPPPGRAPTTGGRAVALRRAPTQARAKERIERMLAAAELVFLEVGYDAATTNQIASRAGTSIGSIYEFFGNKRALATTLAERYVHEMAVSFTERRQLGPEDGGADLASLVDVLDEFARRRPGVGSLLRAASESHELRGAVQALQDELAVHVGRVLAGGFEASDPARRSLVAESCVQILRIVLDDVRASGRSRDEKLAEVKLILTSYATAALPPVRRGESLS